MNADRKTQENNIGVGVGDSQELKPPESLRQNFITNKTAGIVYYCESLTPTGTYPDMHRRRCLADEPKIRRNPVDLFISDSLINRFSTLKASPLRMLLAATMLFRAISMIVRSETWAWERHTPGQNELPEILHPVPTGCHKDRRTGDLIWPRVISTLGYD